VPSVDYGISIAQAYACRRLKEPAEVTYYVRDLMGNAHARVMKLADQSVVETYRSEEARDDPRTHR
jgi:PIN domain nuclease of toxin-antitoxin system